MELPSLHRLYHRGKTYYAENTLQLRKTFNSPIVEQYEKTAAKYKKYINDLGPIIGKVAQKENYRNYLNQQKLIMIKSHLSAKKEELQKQLEEKLDPIKSANGKLHIEITSLHQLQASYNEIKTGLQKNIEQKKAEILELQDCVNKQKQALKELLKNNFKQSKEKIHSILPKITRNDSQYSLHSKDSRVGHYRQSRQSMISKLGLSIKDHTNQKLQVQQQKLIMLKLFLVYYKSIELNQTGLKLVQSLSKQVTVREESIKLIKKQLNQIQLQRLQQIVVGQQVKN